jgi:hypothetical protein
MSEPEQLTRYEAALAVQLSACDALLVVWEQLEEGTAGADQLMTAVASVVMATAEAQQAAGDNRITTVSEALDRVIRGVRGDPA